MCACANVSDFVHGPARVVSLDEDENGRRSGDRTIFIGPEVRAITSVDVSEDALIRQPGRITPTRIICPEPSPDVAENVINTLQATLGVQRSGPEGDTTASGGLGASDATAIAQLGERLATIQLLRDELADLCRSYANGAISQTNYTLRLSQLDDRMVTLLLGEMAAGAFGRQLAASSADAGAASDRTVDAEQLAALETERRTRAGDVANAEAELEARRAARADLPADASDEVKSSAREAVQAAQAQLDRERAELHQLNLDIARHQVGRASAAGAAGVTAAGGVGAIAGRPSNEIAAVAASLADIQQQYLDRDRVGVILDACITALDRRASFDGEELKSRDEIENSIMNIYSEIEELEDRMYDAIVNSSRLQTDLDYNNDGLNIRHEIETANNQVSLARTRIRRRQDRIDQLESDRLALRGGSLTNFAIFCQASMPDLLNEVYGGQTQKLQLRALEQETHALPSAADVAAALDGRTRLEEARFCNLVLEDREAYQDSEVGRAAVERCLGRPLSN